MKKETLLLDLSYQKFYAAKLLIFIKFVIKLNEMKDVLETYYLPCKAKNYIVNINEKSCITILRQFIKIHGYTLISKERHIDRKKVNVYRLIENDKGTTPKKSKAPKNIVISFE